MLTAAQMPIVSTEESTFLPRNGVGKGSRHKTQGAGLCSWDGGSTVGFISAQALGAGGSPGSGDPNQGDFAYAYSSQATTYGLVGWLASGSVWVVQPLQ